MTNGRENTHDQIQDGVQERLREKRDMRSNRGRGVKGRRRNAFFSPSSSLLNASLA